MKTIWFLIQTMFGLAIGLVFYLAYIHVISWLTVPLSILALLAVAFIVVGGLSNLFVNLKDFIVSIFKDDDTLDDRGFKKHL